MDKFNEIVQATSKKYSQALTRLAQGEMQSVEELHECESEDLIVNSVEECGMEEQK